MYLVQKPHLVFINLIPYLVRSCMNSGDQFSRMADYNTNPLWATRTREWSTQGVCVCVCVNVCVCLRVLVRQCVCVCELRVPKPHTKYNSYWWLYITVIFHYKHSVALLCPLSQGRGALTHSTSLRYVIVQMYKHINTHTPSCPPHTYNPFPPTHRS